MEHSPHTRRLIGWKEYVDFLDWGIRHVKAKVDTGARTSAIDVDRYELIEIPGMGLVADLLLALNRQQQSKVVVRVPVLKMVVVHNSSGVGEERPLIETRLRLGPVVKRIRLTVTSRASMRFPMILGRKALENDFVVDVAQQYLLRRKGISNG